MNPIVNRTDSVSVDNEVKKIIASIHSAFHGVSRGEITLHEAEVIDMYGTDEECAVARKIDTDQNWEDIPDAHIEECSCALSYLDPKSWRYYIPRYMEWSLQHFKTNNSIVSDFTIYTLAPSDDPTLAEYSMERYRWLTDEQSQVVYRFLHHMAQNGDFADDTVANASIDKYWGAFSVPSGSLPE